MSTASDNQQFMLNEFNEFKIQFNNQGEQCLISVTHKESDITLDALTTRNIKDKMDAIKHLMGRFKHD